MIPIRTHTRKPTKADVTKKKPFQDLVGGWLASNSHEMLNRRHLDGKPDLVSGNSKHIQALARWMDKLAAEQFIGDDTSGHPEETRAPYRLSLSKIRASNESRAKWVLERWKPSKVEGRSQGGKHGMHDGVRKGPPPRWTHGDLRPYWDLPPRKRRAAVLAASGMSSSRFDQLRPGMDDFLARMREQEQVRDERDFGNLLDQS